MNGIGDLSRQHELTLGVLPAHNHRPMDDEACCHFGCAVFAVRFLFSRAAYGSVSFIDIVLYRIEKTFGKLIAIFLQKQWN